jgi:hypothetical protein
MSIPEPAESAAGARVEVPEGETSGAEATDLAPGLRIVRRRRWYLWWVIIGYYPLMKVTLHFTASFHQIMKVFAVWFVVMFTAAFAAALARCPRCGNYFHMNGMTFLILRRCLHCQLHVVADRRK